MHTNKIIQIFQYNISIINYQYNNRCSYLNFLIVIWTILANIHQKKQKFINRESWGIWRIFLNLDIFLIGIFYPIKLKLWCMNEWIILFIVCFWSYFDQEECNSTCSVKLKIFSLIARVATFSFSSDSRNAFAEEYFLLIW